MSNVCVCDDVFLTSSGPQRTCNDLEHCFLFSFLVLVCCVISAGNSYDAKGTFGCTKTIGALSGVEAGTTTSSQYDGWIKKASSAATDDNDDDSSGGGGGGSTISVTANFQEVGGAAASAANASAAITVQ